MPYPHGEQHRVCSFLDRCVAVRRLMVYCCGRGHCLQHVGAAGRAEYAVEVRAVHEVVESKRHQIQALCRELSVRRLDVFGSAVTDSFNVESSDVDVLVEFEAGPDFDQYFALEEGLEKIIGRPVDVVTASGLANPYFKQRVMQTRELIYAA